MDYYKLLEQFRWNNTPTCPYCGSTKSSPLKKQASRYHCNTCFTHYSVTVKTFLHGTHVDIHKWFALISILINQNVNYGCRKLAAILGVDKKTALRMVEKVDIGLRDKVQRKLIMEIADYEQSKTSHS